MLLHACWYVHIEHAAGAFFLGPTRHQNARICIRTHPCVCSHIARAHTHTHTHTQTLVHMHLRTRVNTHGTHKDQRPDSMQGATGFGFV